MLERESHGRKLREVWSSPTRSTVDTAIFWSKWADSGSSALHLLMNGQHHLYSSSGLHKAALSLVSNLDWRFHLSACSELDSTQAIRETGTNDLEKYWSTTTSQQYCFSVVTKPLSLGGDLLLPEVVHNSQSCLSNAVMLCCTTRKEAMCYLLLYTFKQTSDPLYAHSAMLFGSVQVSSSQTFPHKQRDGDPKGSLHTTR